MNPASTAFDASSPGNQSCLQSLEANKSIGWIVVDARRNPNDPRQLLIDYGDPGRRSAETPTGAATAELEGPPTLRLGAAKGNRAKSFALSALPDTVDFRDMMFEATLVEVPQERTLERYFRDWKARKPVILDQGSEGACTGFGLATVAHFLLQRRKVYPDKERVSARMFYEMARRYDEWKGEDYAGSSVRGAMKGWHKHGICSEKLWPHFADKAAGSLGPERAADALRRPLGAYFRVNHQDLVAMHAAISEVGILYATASVHQGWGDVGKDGRIMKAERMLGGHAFVLVGYDAQGFWLQNSWGAGWGNGGFAHLAYDDWLANGTDVWVARLGAPVIGALRGGKAVTGASLSGEFRRAELQSHTVAVGNDGLPRTTGEVGNSEEDIRRLFARDGDFERKTKDWSKRRLLLYAHGGLVGEADALQRVAEYLPALLEMEIYPVAFVWETDFFSTMGNILKDVLRRHRPEGFLDSAKDFLLDRLDDSLELMARGPGKLLWDEMKENALLSTLHRNGAARVVRECVEALLGRDGSVEVHLAGHSAGSIFLGPWLKAFCESDKTVESLNLWAPACTMGFFHEHYAKALREDQVKRFRLFTLKDPAEQADDCAGIYHKSLLYLVANAFESRVRVFRGQGTPLLGMEKFILNEPSLFAGDAAKVRKDNPAEVGLALGKQSIWIRCPNGLEPQESPWASHSRTHGGFGNDAATLASTLAGILGCPAPRSGHEEKIGAATTPQFRLSRTPGRLRSLRMGLE